ncbi:hypothetical protein MKX01_021017 [Papaver californicum]|nr:hypothetical protein MKX01_021017 [Papaver californicum]
MDAIEFPYQRDVNFMGKGFGRERMLCGEGDHSESISVVSVPGSSVLTGCRTSGSIKDKARAVKQKHGLDGKRSDRKKFKPPMKTKLDSFFSKNGITSSNSSSGGNGILGIYGLKSDIHAVTRHVDELSLNEILDGSYKCPILSQSKGRKSANTTDNILHSVRKVCSILKPQRAPEPSQKDVDLGSGSIKMEACLSDTGFCSSRREESDKEDRDLHGETSSCKIEDFHKKCLDAKLLHQPNVILERLSFLPVKDLDSLLHDTAKPGVSSRVSPDIKAVKGTSQRYRLPPFYWSHSFTGSCKTNVDGSKLTNRSSACQSRWVRIGSTACPQGDNTGCFADLDSFACDYNLISLKQLNLGLSEKEPTSASINFPWTEQVLLSTSKNPLPLGLPHKSDNCLGAKLKFGFNTSIVQDGKKIENSYAQEKYLGFEENKDNGVGGEPSKRRKSACSTEDDSCYSLFKSSVTGYPNFPSQLHDPDNTKHDAHSPRLLAAAQILHEISRLSRTQNQNREKNRWPKKLSQKSRKARKSGSPLGRPEEIPATAKPVTAHIDDDDVMNHDRRSVPSKKPRFLMTNNQIKKDNSQSQPSNTGRGSMIFSPPVTTSIRSSPLSSYSKLGKGLISESKRLNPDNLKVLGIMPPSSTRVLDKSCTNSQQKLRKPLFIDWSRGRSKRA